jgi:hypothetical protein
MYAYDELDRTLINERVSEFRDQVKRRLSGELTEDEFKMLRLQNGVYLQLHAYMFRVAIPYGTLSSKQLRGPMSRAAMTAATAISPHGRTSSSTGSSSPNCRMHWNISPASASMPCRPPATTCATSPRTSGLA